MALKSLRDIEYECAIGCLTMNNGKQVPFGDKTELNLRMREFLDDYVFEGHEICNRLSINVTLFPKKNGSMIDLTHYFGNFLVGARDYFFASEKDEQCFIGQNNPDECARIFYELDLMPRAQTLWPFERMVA